MDKVISERLSDKILVENQFIRMLPLQPIVARIPARNQTPRQMEYIHYKEVAVAMMEIIKYSIGISLDNLAVESIKVFGFSKRTLKIKNKTDSAIQYLLDNHLLG